MPYIDGVEAAKETAGTATVIVFVTAYDKHAIEAFEAGGVDYLLKPLEPARFAKTIEKARSEVRRRRLEASAADAEPNAAAPVLRFKVGRELRYVRLEDIVGIEAANQYANLHLRSGAPILASYSLNEFHAKLNADDFFRVHRSALVNRIYIEAIRAGPDQVLRLHMKGGAIVPVSRRFRQTLSRLAPTGGVT